MATPISSFLGFFLLSITLVVFPSSKKMGFGFEERETIESNDHLLHHHTYTVEVSSLPPSTPCSPSTKDPNRKASLKVIHKYGPCSQLYQDKAKPPTHAEILQQDKLRVKSIHSKLSNKLAGSGSDLRDLKTSTNIPAKSGSTYDKGNYVVTVGLGTPKKDLTLIFDTGSDLTWTQCEPCAESCAMLFLLHIMHVHRKLLRQVVFGWILGQREVDPRANRRIRQLPIRLRPEQPRPLRRLRRAARPWPWPALRRPTNRTQVRPVLLLLPPLRASSTGHLTFGRGTYNASKAVRFTPLSKVSEGVSFYGLNTMGISVGGRRLAIAPSVFSASGTFIDSGVVITHLPPAAYSALRTAFREAMKAYPLTDAFTILDTCYDLSKYDKVKFPKITLSFSGDINVELDQAGVFLAEKVSQVCLAFAGNEDAKNAAILGNVQQQRLEVVYDVAGGWVGFGPAGCS